GDEVDDRGLAAAGAAEEGDDPGSGSLEARLQRELRPPPGERYAQHGVAVSPARGRGGGARAAPGVPRPAVRASRAQRTAARGAVPRHPRSGTAWRYTAPAAACG